jgi:hypothetical protein
VVKGIEHGAWSERERQKEAGRKRHGDAARRGKRAEIRRRKSEIRKKLGTKN